METAQLLGSIGEFVASIAVLATLIYLTVQVKQTKQQLKMSGLQARASHATGVLEPIVGTSDLASIFAKLDFIDYGDFGLTKEETVAFGAWSHIWMQTEQGSFYILPEGSHDELLTWWLSTPAGAEFWDKNRGFYDEAFVKHMDGLKNKLNTDSRSSANIAAGVA
jgi:hypothetical protein